MMTYRTGVMGGQAAAAAMASHLLQRTLSNEQLSLAAYYLGGTGLQTAQAVALGMGSVPTVRADLRPELAAALGLEAGALVKPEELANVLGGRTAQGEEIEAHQRAIRSYAAAEGGEARQRISYMDFCFSVPKAVSVAWMAAETDAERNSILQACVTANLKFLAYIEKEIAKAGFGKGHKSGEERGHLATITVPHFTSRPTLAITRPDPATGVVDTELVEVLRDGLMRGDPQIHFHNIVLNLMWTESGRLVSVNRDRLAGRIHEFGAVGQSFLAAELEAIGVATALDGRTKLLTLPCIPEHVCEEFSKRTKGAEASAREMAREHGLDWDKLDADRKVAMLKGRAQAGRQGKGDDLADAEAWKVQMERLRWRHRSAISYGPANPLWTRDARMEHGFGVTRREFSGEIGKRAVVMGSDARLCAARGMIAAGGMTDAGDIPDITRAMVKRGVEQDGKETKLLCRDAGEGRVKITTELHRDQEEEVVRLAAAAARDTSRALTPERIQAAVESTGLAYDSEHGERQRALIDEVGRGGALGVFIGVAGVGKTSRILPPLVAAAKAQGREVWGTAQAWRQARALHEAGIDHFRCRAFQPFLEGVQAGRTKLTADSVVVLDELSQIGTRQLLHLLRLRERIGFQLYMTGDDRQCQSIEAGPVIELLRRAMGDKAIPEILSTVRQRTERGQEIAGLFRKGTEEDTACAVNALREDRSAELVPGGYGACVERVAALYLERVEVNKDDLSYTVTVTAPTNADALNIGREIRARLQDRGSVSQEELGVLASDGAGNLSAFPVAAGDKVRLYRQTRGVFAVNGKPKSAHVGDNGTVLRVLEVLKDPRSGGLRLETEAGKAAFVSWDALRDRGTGRMLLGLGYCLTIDSAQGVTSDEHISAMPAGSAAVQAFKAYVQASRHRVEHFLIGSRGAEMLEVSSRRPQGVAGEITEEACWANVARNLSKAPLKELASDMLAAVAVETERSAKTLQRVLRLQEAREAAGQAISTLRRSIEEGKAAELLGQLGARLETAMKARAPIMAKLAAICPPPVPVSVAPAFNDLLPVQRQPASAPVPSVVRMVAPNPSLPAKRLKITEQEATEQLRVELDRFGIDVARIKGGIRLDGQRHYVHMKKDKGHEKRGAYRAHFAGVVPAGAMWDHSTGATRTWKAGGEYAPLSPEEAARIAAKQATKAAEREREDERRREVGARDARRLWAASKPAGLFHPYVVAKGIDAAGLRVAPAGMALGPRGIQPVPEGALVVPLRLRPGGPVVNAQTIGADGSKRPVFGAVKIGAHCVLGEIEDGKPVAFAEGLAAAKSFHKATGIATVMCLDSGNLLPVAKAYRELHPDAEFMVAADNDAHLPLREGHRKQANEGLTKAVAVADEVGATVLLPPEIEERTAADKGTDWNDWRVARGLEAVREAVEELLEARELPRRPPGRERPGQGLEL
ncbi:hypothetical protein GCM10009416_33810 [Craurococcus roseus]|uniref:TrwC relaxase domain-containing protein n=1 Tax=Craurococcus roseus TaxID=77585 RepID=A0ABN1FKC6_9PROT